MAQHLSQHLWSVAILVGSASLAFAAERIATAGARSEAGLDVGGLAGIESYIGPMRSESLPQTYAPSVTLDPFDSRSAFARESAVASQPNTPTVPSASAGRLTAILVADNRRVAVIDEAAVSVGDVLRDGSRVSAIQPDRVWVVEKSGRWRMLTLANRGTR